MKRFAYGLVLALLAACGGEREPSGDVLPVSVSLSPDSVRHRSPVFSPDGTRVAFWTQAADSTADWVLIVANADLSAPRTLDVRTIQSSPIIWHPDGTRLAAASSQFGAADVVLVTVATGETIRATRDPGFEIPVGWGGDGTKLAYLRTAADGTFRTDLLNVSDLTSTPMLPGESRFAIGIPSPDGAHVAYQLTDGSSTTIWVADGNGANRRQLSTDGLETIRPQPWSPDSKEILYQSRRTGTDDLWIAHLDSASPRQLTRNVRNETDGVWSPDGQWIAFLSDRGKQTDVWVVPAKGGEEQRVTNSSAEEEAPLSWRPGTNELTFVITSETNGLWAVDMETGVERRLTPDSLRLSDFWLSPDGTEASVIIEHGGGARDLGVLPIAGGAIRTLVSEQSALWSALHSPDGRQIAYISDRAGSLDLWVVDAAGGAPRQLVNWTGAENSFAWSEDGTALYFVSDRDSRLGDVWRVPSAGGEPTRVTRDGAILDIRGRSGYPGMYVSRLNPTGGQVGVARLRDDGSVQTVWDRTNVGLVFPLSRDSLIAMVEQPDGTTRAMILSASGGGGRVILKANERAGWPTPDGTALLYSVLVRGAVDLAVLDIARDTVRRLTTTPDDELGAEFTPDHKTLVFVRQRAVERIHSVDLSALLRGRAP